MIATILALGVSVFSFDPSPVPGATHECQAAVIRSGEAWCEIDGTPVRCQMIQPPENIECIVTDNCAYAAHDPELGEVLMIWIRAMSQGVASPVCTHDGGPDDCGTVEHIEGDGVCSPIAGAEANFERWSPDRACGAAPASSFPWRGL